MLTVAHRYLVRAAAIVLLLGSGGGNVHASTITTGPKATSISNIIISAPTCEFRTINYITNTLPQLCLKSSWSNANGTTAKSAAAEQTVTSGEVVDSTREDGREASSTSVDTTNSNTGNTKSIQATSISSTSTTASEAEATATDLESGELNEASFLSFEEWKKQTLEKAGQANANIGNKRSGEGKKRDSDSFQNHLESLGDDGEIDIDIGFRRGGREGGVRDGSQNLEAGEYPLAHDSNNGAKAEKEKDHYRSKDAGRTCKERFSYASFDAGATVLKTHPGAKNSKAVLIENKDSYMLSECSTDKKFIVIELSEDIWIDTIVLANYEFFSSMIRNFRVSVSDRYPVKTDKWKDVGAFEARNSRDIQAFLVENPQIWARYIRIEFLSHYGNEYYCPLSLVRVHGTRMLESWKESEASADDEDAETESESEDQFVPEAVAETVKEQERQNAELKDAELKDAEAQAAQVVAEDIKAELNATGRKESVDSSPSTSPWEKPQEDFYWMNVFNVSQAGDICHAAEAPVQSNPTPEPSIEKNSVIGEGQFSSGSMVEGSSVSATPTTSSPTQAQKPTTVDVPIMKDSSSSTNYNSTTYVSDAPVSYTASTTGKPTNVTNSVKNKTTSTSPASSPLPTIQESFFKAVSRRLNFLETNSTLSLKYIEDQSRILREAFTRVEKKQMQKTTVFLESLNSTVLDELRGFRQQYDEIWQSTVISLESQREESRKEILAISSRLNILADEVVFQKRMSIVQSVLLLLCLGLVIFSRVSGGPNIDIPYLQGRVRHMSGYPVESPLESPTDSPAFYTTTSTRERKWLQVDHRRQRSDDTVNSRSRSRENSPPTPISTYSRSEELAFTPPSGVDDANGDSSADFAASETVIESTRQHQPSKSSSYHSASAPPEPEVEKAPQEKSPIPLRSPGPQNTSIRQQVSPPTDLEDWPLPLRSNRPSSPLSRPLFHQESDPIEPNINEVIDGAELEQAYELDGDTRMIPTIQFSSSPETSKRASFSIARKPLPALPPVS